MSKEDLIKYVNEIIKDCKNEIKGKDYFEYIMTPNDIHAIQGLLDLYNKEKEKNKELEERINKAIAFINNDDVYFTDGEIWKNVLYIESVLKGE